MSDDETLVRQRLARLTAEPNPTDPYTALTRPLRSPFEGMDHPATFATTFPPAEPAPPAADIPADTFGPEPATEPRRLLGGAGPFDPGRRGVKALAAVAAVVVLAAAFFAYRARPKVEPVAPVSPAAEVAAPATSGPAEILVSVAGKVRKPGLVRLPAGARVADAVEAAGGALPDTDLASINLARRLTDGEMVLVGITPPPGVPASAAPGGPEAGAGGKVNLNTATLAELDSLPGVGPVLAQRILELTVAGQPETACP
ncbi:SLBB domain-containing protein, partial [Asanoa sp. NPDC050611]|uniref:SLBB domain-containing protein n=1 Tax=Asanoa sp. NPDC050611 TaxID=3157098 RepID=UPI003409E0FA